MPQMPEKDISFLKMREEWQAPFMYRKRINDDCELYETNGCYPNEKNPYALYPLNIRAATDDNGHIKEITYYKLRNTDCGHGRPSSSFSDLNATDKKLFSSILDKSTISRADKVLPELLEKAMSVGLPEGWSIKKCTAASVTFTAPDGNTISVTKSRVLKYLEISYCYLEILTDADFWDANPKFLKPEDKSPMLALFSHVDTSGYYNLEKIKENASEREFNSTRASGYRILSAACENNDLAAAESYAIYAKPNYMYCPKDVPPPLYSAVKHNNLPLIKLLLNNRAAVNTAFGYFENGKCRTPLQLAIETENDEAISLLMAHFDGFEISSAFEETKRLAKEYNRPELAIEIQNAYDTRMEELRRKYCKQDPNNVMKAIMTV